MLVVAIVIVIVGVSSAVIYAIRNTGGTAAGPTVTESPPAKTGEPAQTAKAEPSSRPSEPAEPSEPPRLRVTGGTIKLHGFEGLVMGVTATKVIVGARPANEYITPKKGFQWVAVEFVLRNIGNVPYDDAPSNSGLLIDTKGRKHQATYGEVLDGDALNGTVKVSPGAKRKGMLIFEVPRGTRLATFQFTLNSGFADEHGKWSIKS